MEIINKEFKFDTAHILPNHYGQCKNLHGHTYKLIVSCTGEHKKDLSSECMIIDFSKLKKIVEENIINRFDHAFILGAENEEVEKDIKIVLMKHNLKFVDLGYRSTAENISKYIFNKLKPILKSENIELIKITLYETETSYIEYTEL